jgi:mannonate dehydratase
MTDSRNKSAVTPIRGLDKKQVEELRRRRALEREKCFFKPVFRWYHQWKDRISLSHIGEMLGVSGIIGMVPQSPGEVVTEETVAMQQMLIEGPDCQLDLAGYESIFVSDRIKYRMPGWHHDLDNYLRSIENIGRRGVKMITYNAMGPVDWIRTEPRRVADGSLTLAFDQKKVRPLEDFGNIEALGWGCSYTPEKLAEVIEHARLCSNEQLRDNIVGFLESALPVAEANGVKLCLHPDDPPWSPFPNIPRAASTLEDYVSIIEAIDSPSNCACVCTGALGANPENNMLEVIDRLKGKIGFVHLRLTQRTSKRNAFSEVPHTLLNEAGKPENRFTAEDVVLALYEAGFRGPLRADHAGAYFGEPLADGYTLHGRAMAIAYIYGLGTMIKRIKEGPVSLDGYALLD